MKNFKLALGLLALSVLAAPSYAQQGRATGGFTVPYDSNRNLAPDLSFVGVAVDTASAAGTVTGNQVSAANVARLYFAGEGVFYDLVVSSGAASDWAACWDAAAVAETFDPFKTADNSLIAAVQAITTEWRRFSGTQKGVVPIRIRKGLVCDSTFASKAGQFYAIFEKK